MGRAMLVTFFRDYAAREAFERDVAIERLVDGIRARTAARKDQLPWLKLARFGDRPSAAASLRHDENVTAITGIEADYDGGEVGFDYAVEVAEKAGLRGIIYASPSHTP